LQPAYKHYVDIVDDYSNLQIGKDITFTLQDIRDRSGNVISESACSAGLYTSANSASPIIVDGVIDNGTSRIISHGRPAQGSAPAGHHIDGLIRAGIGKGHVSAHQKAAKGSARTQAKAPCIGASTDGIKLDGLKIGIPLELCCPIASEGKICVIIDDEIARSTRGNIANPVGRVIQQGIRVTIPGDLAEGSARKEQRGDGSREVFHLHDFLRFGGSKWS